jgi:hypothetical protein
MRREENEEEGRRKKEERRKKEGRRKRDLSSQNEIICDGLKNRKVDSGRKAARSLLTRSKNEEGKIEEKKRKKGNTADEKENTNDTHPSNENAFGCVESREGDRLCVFKNQIVNGTKRAHSDRRKTLIELKDKQTMRDE